MESATVYLLIAVTSLLAITLVSSTVLRGWRDWLAFRKHELESIGAGEDRPNASPSTASRIEMADLKERIRKLEAIAAGVEL